MTTTASTGCGAALPPLSRVVFAMLTVLVFLSALLNLTLVSLHENAAVYDALSSSLDLFRQRIGTTSSDARLSVYAANSTKTTSSIARPPVDYLTLDALALTPHIPVTITLLPQQLKPNQYKANARHLMWDGIEQSPLLSLLESTNGTPTTDWSRHVWVLDHLAARHFWVPQKEENAPAAAAGDDDDDGAVNWCASLTQHIRFTMLRRNSSANDERHPPKSWPLLIIDNRDYPIISSCPSMAELLGANNIRYSYRSAVKLRKWIKEKQWVRLGKIVDPLSKDDADLTLPLESYHFVHRPIGVRTDIVREVASRLQEDHQSELCHDIENLERPTDVAYFWEHSNYEGESCFLRDYVHEVLTNYSLARSHNVTTRLGLQGKNAQRGRKQVSSDYVQALLTSKIVVVTQRDSWEDHYRLLEAIVAGAMVMTDSMLSLPNGLENGLSLVEYASAQELEQKLDYYLSHPDERLSVARRGRYVAMSRHRSWHHMEAIIYGRPVSVCDTTTTTSHDGNKACPYIVNAGDENQNCSRLRSGASLTLTAQN